MSTKTTKTGSRLARLGALLAACAAIFAAQAPAAAAEVRWTSNFWWTPVHLQEGEKGYFAAYIGNAGDTTGTGQTVTIELPPGVTWDGTQGTLSQGQWACAGAGTSTVHCPPVSNPVTTPPGGFVPFLFSISEPALRLRLDVAPGSSGLHQITVTVAGGGAPEPDVQSAPVRISTTPAPFGLDPDNVIAGAFDAADQEFTQAGGHPADARASLRFPTRAQPTSTPAFIFTDEFLEDQALADIVASLPPGFLGDPTAMAQCTEAQFESQLGCPPETQVGVIELGIWQLPRFRTSGVYNMVPPPNLPARFAFRVPTYTVFVDPSVRADGDYGITMSVEQIHEKDVITHSRLVIWGNPHDPVNDVQRCHNPNPNGFICNGRDYFGVVFDPEGEFLMLNDQRALAREVLYPRSSSLPERAFLSMPTNCADTPSTSFNLSTYQDRPSDRSNLEDPRWHKWTVNHADHTGCAAVPFDPTIDFEPTAKAADTPTGLDVHLNIPRDADKDENGIPDDSDQDGLIQAHLKKTTVTLPRGFAFNASAADGILGCTPAQIGLVSAPGQVPYRFNNNQPNCPQASKIANAKVITPVLERELTGEVFLASQNANPFNSTYAIYITVREPSILVKLPGKVELDPATGQITTTFDHNPQLPFSDLTLDFFGGPRGSLATPKTCGAFTTRTEFVPWSAQDPNNPQPSEVVISNDAFTIGAGANGAPCASQESELPFDLGLTAGSQNPAAGQSSPFHMQLTRPDGHQDIDRLQIAMPPGFTASLRGLPACSEEQIAATSSRPGKAEEAGPACPPASQIGTTLAGAGAGTNPLYRPGKLYLAGPYKGHPLSVLAVTPAVAGPFDLGNVVIRSALAVDPVSARVTAITDPIPQVFAGVPLRIRDIRIAIDRPGFALNPTNCAELATEVRSFGAAGGADVDASRFQAAGCRNLPFKPRINIQLFGGTKRAAYQGVRAIVRPRAGDANVSGAVVKFPTSAFVAQEHLNNICTRVQWANEACPRNSVYGTAEARSPLLDAPLKGNVHLRSSTNLLPDLVADLRGPAHQPIRIEVAIKNDSVKGALRNTVQSAPDAPVSFFRLQTFGGKKGLIVNSRNICQGANAARVTFRAHNGRRATQSVPVRNARCAKQRKAAKRKAMKRLAAKRSVAAQKQRQGR